MLKTPNFTWGGRVANAPPNTPFPGFLNMNPTDDISISFTKLAGRHTFKAGFYNTHSYKAQQQGTVRHAQLHQRHGQSARHAVPVRERGARHLQPYQQQSRYIEGIYVYNNTEATSRTTGRSATSSRSTTACGSCTCSPSTTSSAGLELLPGPVESGQAPRLYVPAAPTARGPVLGHQPAGDESADRPVPRAESRWRSARWCRTPGTANGLFLSGQGIAETTYTWPALGFAPRFGMAYDLSGKQRSCCAAACGLFFDRPSGNSIYAQVRTRPRPKRHRALRHAAGSWHAPPATEGAPGLTVFEYDCKVPSSIQWNGGMQMPLPWSTSLDVEYVGQHSWNMIET